MFELTLAYWDTARTDQGERQGSWYLPQIDSWGYGGDWEDSW